MVKSKYKRIIETDGQIFPSMGQEMNYSYIVNLTHEIRNEYYKRFDDLLAFITEIETKFGRIIITSAFRCQAWEYYRKRSGRSIHTYGLAVDFYHPKLSEIHEYLKQKNLRELIYYEKRNFIHVAL